MKLYEQKFREAYAKEFAALCPETQAVILAQPDCRAARNLETRADAEVLTWDEDNERTTNAN